MQAVPRCPARAAGGNEPHGSVCRHCRLAGPTAGLNPHPETAAQRFVRRFLFFAGFRARHIFHKYFTFWSFDGSAAAPSQSVTAASQYRLSTVSKAYQIAPLKFPYSSISPSFCGICRYIIGSFCASCPILGDSFAVLPLIDRPPPRVISSNHKHKLRDRPIGGRYGLCPFYNM